MKKIDLSIARYLDMWSSLKGRADPSNLRLEIKLVVDPDIGTRNLRAKRFERTYCISLHDTRKEKSVGMACLDFYDLKSAYEAGVHDLDFQNRFFDYLHKGIDSRYDNVLDILKAETNYTVAINGILILLYEARLTIECQGRKISNFIIKTLAEEFEGFWVMPVKPMKFTEYGDESLELYGESGFHGFSQDDEESIERLGRRIAEWGFKELQDVTCMWSTSECIINSLEHG